jgi:hypothetical protein
MQSTFTRWLLAGLLCPLTALPSQAQQPSASPSNSSNFVWWEAEDARVTNFPAPAQNPFRPFNEKEAAVLSGGQWIGAGDERKETLFLEYDVQVPKSGTYEFYARKFWQHGPFRYRFDNGEWREVRRTALMDSAELRLFTVANWVSAGAVPLTAGKHTVRIELLENNGAASFDAFLLTAEPFRARGKLKPGEKYNRTMPGWFAFEPDADRFAPSPIDLRSLNEKFAGENGFIRTRGEEFVHSNTNRPVRFWAVNTGAETMSLNKNAVDLMARTLAKNGVNLIRIHGGVWSSDLKTVDQEHLQKIFYFITAMKREGIYTCLSIYFPLWMKPDEKTGYDGYKGDKNPFALLFFNRDFQQVYRNWWKEILTTKNPHTGLTLAQDPAVAMLEMLNEDSYLFWTFKYENIPTEQMDVLEGLFGTWLTNKYGSIQAALTHWSSPHTRDNVAAGRVGFITLWEIVNKKDFRAQDTATFLTLNQREFFSDTYKYLRQDLGFGGSVYASNWTTANNQILGPLEKYSNASADFIDRHGYFSGVHEGERAGHAVSVGDKYADRSALLFEPNRPGEQPNFSLPIQDIRYNNQPSTITEINWTPPNRFRADFPLLCAAYGSLQGSDGVFFFATGSPSWEERLGKFSIRTPVIEGQFPALALMYRQGLVSPGREVVEVNMKTADMFALKGAPVSSPVNLDELRAQDIPAGQSKAVSEVKSIDPLATLVGKVAMNFSEQGAPSRISDLSRYIDHERKIVRSVTGELMWDYGRGLVTVNAPKAQAVSGFLAGNPVRLGEVAIQSPLQYGTITLVSLDNQPLETSRRMLLQTMSEDINYGWETSGEGLKEIKSLGDAPIVVKNLAGTVAFKRPDAASLKVTPLDFNGYAQKGSLQTIGANKSISLQPNTLYYLIEK